MASLYRNPIPDSVHDICFVAYFDIFAYLGHILGFSTFPTRRTRENRKIIVFCRTDAPTTLIVLSMAYRSSSTHTKHKCLVILTTKHTVQECLLNTGQPPEEALNEDDTWKNLVKLTEI